MIGHTRNSFFVFLIGLFLLGGAGAGFATEYPIRASCTGENVRLREDPSTKAKIVGKVNRGNDLYVLGETSVNGEVWYEIAHPTQKDTAWIFGKYVNLDCYYDGSEIPPGLRLSWKIQVTFGDNLDKARALFGKPQKESKKMTWIEGAEANLPDITLTWPTHTAQYIDGGLKMVRVSKGTMPFGSLRIGDPISNVSALLGETGEQTSEHEWCYELGYVETLTFKEFDGKIATMEYLSWFE